MLMSGVEAMSPWTDVNWSQAMLTTKLKASVASFTNVLTQGFGLGPSISAAAVKGADPFIIPDVEKAFYSGSWFKTTTAGIGLVVIDGIIGVIARFGAGRRVKPKIMGKQLISG